MLQQEGKWLTCRHHFIFKKNSIVSFQFPCNHNERMNENVYPVLELYWALIFLVIYVGSLPRLGLYL